MFKKIYATVTAILAVTVAGCAGAYSGDDLKSLFADVEINNITSERAVDNGVIRLMGFMVSRPGGEGTAAMAHGLRLSLKFHVGDADAEHGVPVTAVLEEMAADGGEAFVVDGIGFLKDNRLKVYQGCLSGKPDTRPGTMSYPVAGAAVEGLNIVTIDSEEKRVEMFSADVSNIAHFITTLHYQDNDYYAELYDEQSYLRILTSTPTSTYEGSDGTEAQLQMFRAPKNPIGVESIVYGKLSIGVEVSGMKDVYLLDDSYMLYGALNGRHEFDLTARIEGYGTAKAHVKWSKERLLLTDFSFRYYKIKEMEMPLVECMVYDNAEINEGISELEDESLYTEGAGVRQRRIYPETDTYEAAEITLRPQGGNRYDVTNLMDGNAATAWAVGAGEYAAYARVNKGEPRSLCIYTRNVDDGPIRTIRMRNGYCKSHAAWENNARVKRMIVKGYPANGDSETILYDGIVEDTDQWQTIDLDNTAFYDYYYIFFTEMYPGSKYQDLCISEMEFWGE